MHPLRGCRASDCPGLTTLTRLGCGVRAKGAVAQTCLTVAHAVAYSCRTQTQRPAAASTSALDADFARTRVSICVFSMSLA